MSEREKALSILKKLNDNGHQAFIVGGAVRDSLLGKNPKDYDISVNSPVGDILNLFPSGKFIDPSQAFPVVLVDGVEIASFRKDVVGKSRRDLTSFEVSVSIFDDAIRRDISINSLYMGVDGKILDPTGFGFEDIRNKVIRLNGNAQERLMEDPLRALRVVRFAARLGFSLNNDCKVALSGAKVIFK